MPGTVLDPGLVRYHGGLEGGELRWGQSLAGSTIRKIISGHARPHAGLNPLETLWKQGALNKEAESPGSDAGTNGGIVEDEGDVGLEGRPDR